MEYKHYIRINSQNRIIAAFSDAFQSPQDGDILYRETDDRHFNIDLYREDGFFRYEWDGKEIVVKGNDVLIAESNEKKIAELKKHIYENWLDSGKTQDEIKKQFKTIEESILSKKSVDVSDEIKNFKKWMEEK